MKSKKKKTKTTMAEEPIANYGKEELNFEKIWLMFKETDKQFKETDKQFKETDKKIKELSELFTSQWGKLVESLVEGSVIRLFRDTGIDVHYTSERVKGKIGGDNIEFDILAHNEVDLVVIEVKTTLRPKDVKEFLIKLGKFKNYFPTYTNHKIRGSVAFLTAYAGAETQAQKEGLYAIKATGESAVILNPDGFKPRIY